MSAISSSIAHLLSSSLRLSGSLTSHNFSRTSAWIFPRTCSPLLSSALSPDQSFGNRSKIHTSAGLWKKSLGEAISADMHWTDYNKIILPPQLPNEPRRPAQVFHYRTQIRYSERNLWYLAQMIRGMSIDEAIKQLSFHHKKGAAIIKEILLEAQEMGLRDHNFEFKSKMWVAESFAGKGVHMKGLRRHAKGRYGRVSYNFNHYFVKLEEGDPPANYYPNMRPTMSEAMKNFINGMRGRRIINSL